MAKTYARHAGLPWSVVVITEGSAVDYQTACTIHEWASLRVTQPDDIEPCPLCVMSHDVIGRHRYERLTQEMIKEGQVING